MSSRGSIEGSGNLYVIMVTANQHMWTGYDSYEEAVDEAWRCLAILSMFASFCRRLTKFQFLSQCVDLVISMLTTRERHTWGRAATNSLVLARKVACY